MSKTCRNHSFTELLTILWDATSVDNHSSSRYTVKKVDLCLGQLDIISARLRGLRNSVQPINSLPTEILVKIFRQCQCDFSDFLPHRIGSVDKKKQLEWQKLFRVCRHWRGIVSNSPTLWTHVDHAIQLNRFLKRSASAPISAYVGVRGDFDVPSLVLDHITTQMHRIERLHINLPSYYGPDVCGLSRFTAPAPLINSLTIEVTSIKAPPNPWIIANPGAALNPFDDSTGETLFGGEYSSLRRISIRYFIPPLSKMNSLTHVCLYDQGPGRLSLSAYLDFLDNNPSLRFLSLVNAGPDFTILPTVDPSRISRLEHLDVLDLGEWISCSHVSQFLSHLYLPKKTKLYIWGSFFIADSAGDDIGNILPVDYENLENVSFVNSWSLIRDSWPSYRGPSASSPVPVVIIAFVDRGMYMRGLPSPSKIISGIMRFPLSKVKRLTVRETSLVSSQLDLNAWRVICRSLPRLKHIAILSESDHDFPRGLLLALASSQDDSESVTPMFCPNIKTLFIEDSDDNVMLFAILNLLEARFSSKGLGRQLKRLTIAVRDSSDNNSLSGDEEEGKTIVKTLEKLVEKMDFIEKPGGRIWNARVEMPNPYMDESNFGLEVESPLAVPPGWPSKAFLWTRMKNLKPGQF